MSHEAFALWEKEFGATSTSPGDLIAVTDTLTLAKELQVGIAQLPPDERKPAGLEALRLINDMQPDVQHKQYGMHAIRSFLYLDHLPPDESGMIPAVSFGEMRLGGQIGYYTFASSARESTINLQVFEPEQYQVTHPKDVFRQRLPVPLSVPVLGIESLIRLK